MRGWVVWSKGPDGWWPSETMERADANDLAEAFHDQGTEAIIRRSHSVTMAEIVNG